MNRRMQFKSVALFLLTTGLAFAHERQWDNVPSALAIHGPKIVGTTPGKPFLFLIPVTSNSALRFSATGLPPGINLDSRRGILSGTALYEGQYKVQIRVQSDHAQASSNLTIVAEPNSLALTPPMGWNSWNVWGCEVDESKIREAADSLIDTGLASHGFQYVNIDDCWMGERDRNGKIQTNSKFGDMKKLVDYVHSKGLRLGIYSSPGPKTCQGYAGSQDHEQEDAASYAEWGVDYLKYDWCSYQGDPIAPYRTMGDALKTVSRDIVYSICQYGGAEVWKWAPSVGGHLWRTTTDVTDTWKSISNIISLQNGLEAYSSPGHWNDPDMLVIGTLGGAWEEPQHPSRLSHDEQITHISLWSMLSAPLLIGADLKKLDPFTIELLANDDVIAIDQDSLGVQAKKVIDQSVQIWQRPLSDGTFAVAVLNPSNQATSYQMHWDGFSNELPVRDLWKRQVIAKTGASTRLNLSAHGTVLMKVGNPSQ